MSRTNRTIPGWVRNKSNKDFANALERGHIDIPKRDPESSCGDEIWGQRGKKFRRKFIKRQRRLAEKEMISCLSREIYPSEITV